MVCLFDGGGPVRDSRLEVGSNSKDSPVIEIDVMNAIQVLIER